MLQIGLMADGVLYSCLNAKEGDDAGSGGQILVSFLSLSHDDSLTRSFCSPTFTNPVFLTKWSVDPLENFLFALFNECTPGVQLVGVLRYEPEGRGFDSR